MNGKLIPVHRTGFRIGLITCLAGSLLSATAGAGFAFMYDRHNSPSATELYAETHRGHLQRLDANANPGRVVFLGSSTFQGLDTAAISPVALNLGMGGDTLSRITARARDYGSISQAGAVIMNIGLNDIMHTCRAISGEVLQALFELIPESMPLMILGIQGVSPRRHGARCGGGVTGLIAETNMTLANRCAQAPNCRFVTNPIPADIDAIASQTLHEPDGIHLSPSAYTELKHRLRDALAAAAPNLAQPAQS